MKKFIIIFGILIVIGVALWLFVFRHRSSRRDGYEFTPIEKGDIVNIVSSTGTLEPVGIVDVGTQVSGTIEKVLVDFNDLVKKGQLLAVIDTTVLSTYKRDAIASFNRARAQYELSKMDYEREKSLFEKGLSSEVAVEKLRATMEINKANLDAAMTALERAKLNLKYALIRSPIDGIVVDRKIEPGQTVAASMSAPTLFLIAEDLSNMRILVNVDESDIGSIKNDMTAQFEVPSYPNEKFVGRVTQIRLQPTVSSNVVNYTVVVEARNDKGLLKPGMTATVDFLIDERHDVFRVKNSVFNFKPTETMLAEFRKTMAQLRQEGQERLVRGDSAFRPNPGARRDSTTSHASASNDQRFMGFQRSNDIALLWYLDAKGNPTAIPVRKGATDGKFTEVIPIRGELTEGMQMIVKAPPSKATATNPFMPPGPPRGR